jgi:hypothetical protein
VFEPVRVQAVRRGAERRLIASLLLVAALVVIALIKPWGPAAPSPAPDRPAVGVDRSPTAPPTVVASPQPVILMAVCDGHDQQPWSRPHVSSAKAGTPDHPILLVESDVSCPGADANGPVYSRPVSHP